MVGELQPGNIAVVTVTYGDRGESCAQVVNAALEQDVQRIIVVDNASAPTSRRRLEGLAKDPRVTLLSLGRNLGSAGGYGAGMDAAVSTGAPWILFLDDDNVMQPDALEQLCRSLGEVDDGEIAGAMTRLEDPHHRLLRDGHSAATVYPQPGEFFGFDVRRRLTAGKLSERVQQRSGPVQIPYGPYGGLVVRRHYLMQMAGPIAEFVLYCDDYEFTERLARCCRIMLAPSALIDDIGARWSLERSGSFTRDMIRSEDRARLYYLARNLCVLERGRLRTTRDRMWYRVNAAVYWTALVTLSAQERRPRVLADFGRARRDGKRRRLGRIVDLD